MDSNCVFCDQTKFAERHIAERIVAEDQNFYVIATLGQITDGGYLLLVPKRHVSCVGAMKQAEVELFVPIMITKILGALRREYRTAEYVIFEHGIVGQTIQHAHLHFMPALCDLTSEVQKDFPGKAIDAIPSWVWLRDLYTQRQEPYLLWTSNGWVHVCWDPPAPPQYFRTALAKSLGRPERKNWQDMDPALDKRLWTETVARLKPYFC